METIIENEDTLGTPIQEFFRGRNVFITGGTGFMGKVLIEKILRSCPHVSKIYLLVRPKKDKDPQERIVKLLDDILFAKIGSKTREKLVAIRGDCSLPGLGISEYDRSLLKEKINIIIHSAATVRFDDGLGIAVAINVSATKEILQLGHEITDLKSIVHISTAFAHCHLKDVGEKFYDPVMTYEDLVQIIGCFNEEMLYKITPILMGDRPNTYVYTKSVAEDLVRQQGKGLPLAIFRPAIVVSTISEPISGWIDNINGPTGIVVGSGTGVLKTMNCDENTVANIVPVDMACNAIIATAWEATQRKIDTSFKEHEEGLLQEPLIYNYVSSVEKPITWSMFVNLAYKYGIKTPPIQLVWYFCLTLHTSSLLHYLSVIFLHLFPAVVMDFAAKLMGKRARMVKLYKTINKLSNIITYFLTKNWNYDNSNVQALWKRLDPKDQEIFPFSITDINWETFFHHYTTGIRLYIVKDDLSTIPQAIVKLNRFYWLHQGIKCLFGFCVLKLVWFLAKYVFANTGILEV